MTHTEGRGVGEGFTHSIKWPDRSARTLAVVWKLTAEQVKAEQFVDRRQHEWRRS